MAILYFNIYCWLYLIILRNLETGPDETIKFKINKLIFYSSGYNFRLTWINLRKHQWYSVHSNIEEKFYHYKDRNRRYLTNCDEDKNLCEKYKNKKTIEGTMNAKVDQINSFLNNFSLSNIKRNKLVL